MKASVGFCKRCSCLDTAGRALCGTCPRLYDRGHGGWYFRLELPHGHNGKRRQLRRGGYASRDAARQARDYLHNPATAEPTAALITVGQWMTLWGDMRIGTQQSTLSSYRQHIRSYITPYLGDGLLRELTPEKVQAMFTAIVRTHGAAGSPLAPGTLQRIHATLRAGLNAAVRRKLIPTNPGRCVELPPGRRPTRSCGHHPCLARKSAEATAQLVMDTARSTGTRLRPRRKAGRTEQRSNRRPVPAGRQPDRDTHRAAR